MCVMGGSGYQQKLAELEAPSTHTLLPFMKQLLKVEVPRSTLFSQPQLPVRAEPNVLPL